MNGKKNSLDQQGAAKIEQKALYDLKRIDEEQLKMLIDAVEVRNETTYVYDENFAERVAEKILMLYPAMQYVMNAMSQDI